MEKLSERLQTPISTSELERRWAAVRAAMGEQKIDALLMQNNNDYMGGYVKYFTDLPATNGYPQTVVFPRDEMMTLAEYFSKQPWPSLRQPPASAEETAAAQRANASIGCTGCHLGEYQGDGTQPRLAGQRREYLAQTMLAFRTRARANNPGMTDLMRATSEAEIAAMAVYLAGR